MSRIPQQRSGLDRRPISSKQQITGINVLSLLPRLIRDIPKLVILRRRNRRVADLELDEGVFVWPGGEDFSGAGLAGFEVVPRL